MNGETLTGGQENLRILVEYKGSGLPGEKMQDMDFLYHHGFTVLSDCPIAVKEVKA